jgi:hypothetical protein
LPIPEAGAALLFAFVEALVVAVLLAVLDELFAFAARGFAAFAARRGADLRRVEEEREAMKFNPSGVSNPKVGFFVTASQDGTKKRHPDDNS